MKLPKLDLPLYKTTLPVRGDQIKYRPYTVKEEKIILIAATTGEAEQLEDAVTQVLENCCSVEVEKLHPTDVEWLFIKNRIVSVGVEATVDIPVFKCTTPECPESITTKVNLENDVVVKGKEILENTEGFVKKKDGWLVMFTEDIGMQFKINTSKSKTEGDVLWDCFVSMYISDQVISKEDITKEEYIAYMDDLPRPYADKIEFLFANQPWLVATVKGKCEHCGKEHSVEVSGILDFLE
jgi:hypothetical protein